MRPRHSLLLVMTAAACGGRAAPARPEDRAAVRVVRCREAQPLPSLGAEPAVFGALVGEGGIGELVLRSDGAARGLGIGTIGVGGGGVGAGLGGIGTGGGGGGSGAAGGEAPPAITAAIGAPAVIGALAAPAVAAALAARAGAVQACAAAARQIDATAPFVKAMIAEWRLTIGARGEVVQAGAMSRELEPALAACATAALRGGAYPAPPDARPVAVRVNVHFGSGVAAKDDALAAPEVEPWTPFASEALVQSDPTGKIARAAEGALRGRLGALEACFAGSRATGSLRAVLSVDVEGDVTAVRAGGLGDRVVEACVENAVTGMRALAPSRESADLACDVSRGDAQPWRLTVDRAGYGVVEVGRARVRHGDQELLAAVAEPESLEDHTAYALVVEPDATGATLALALAWTSSAAATLVGVRAAAGAPPVYVGMGLTSATFHDDEGDALRPTVQLGAAAATACLDGWTREARLADPAAVGAAVQQLAARCRTHACAASLVVAVGADAAARELLEVHGAARRAGFERVLLVRGPRAPGPAGSDGGGPEPIATCARAAAESGDGDGGDGGGGDGD